ncbi:shufflon system plasmid conjugative transfer pilus tip adhesin PilV, partial [Pseudomonas aeruginosa]|uniref:shufflon system plasmid conjugative transfer pilus tip adhesin PilV n=1 Tax=Pseudomonas aeruginosa TaxID=287 RepID=UPI00356B6F20
EGRTEVGEFLQLNGVATEGAGCSPNGLVGRNAAGLTLSCQSGVWKASDSGGTWGGSFWSQSGACINGNPLTGACSCPVGYNANVQFDIWVNGCWPCRSFSCYKP